MLDIGSRPQLTAITVGTVVDTNDFMQGHRVKVMVPAYGDQPESPVESLPWTVVAAMSAGVVDSNEAQRGPEKTTSDGGIAYGFWCPPKVGAVAIVTCIDGNPSMRVALGFVHTEGVSHTLPHGRYTYNTSNVSSAGEPAGPLTTNDKPLEPLFSNQTTAFGSRSSNYEWRTRGADRSASSIDKYTINETEIGSKAIDDRHFSFSEANGNTIDSVTGFDAAQIDPNREYKDGENLDNHTFTWVTPGFHAITMDDRASNCRMRLRTTTGHQILLDDTNERIYVSTNEGRNWLEMDSDGNIDIFASTKVSVHGESDVNVTSDATLRFYGADGVHIYSGAEVCIQSVVDTNIKSGQSVLINAASNVNAQAGSDVNTKSGGSTNVQSGGSMHIKSGETLNLQSSSALNVKSGEILNIGAGSVLNLLGSSDANLQGGAIVNVLAGGQLKLHGNGGLTKQAGAAPAGSAGSASSAANAGAVPASWTNRVPQHEPWGRMTTADDYSHEGKYGYDDPNVGKEDKQRNPLWHR